MRNLVKSVLRRMAGLLSRVRVAGALPDVRSRLLVVANHESFLDGLLLGLFLPIDPVFVVHTGVVRVIHCSGLLLRPGGLPGRWTPPARWR